MRFREKYNRAERLKVEGGGEKNVESREGKGERVIQPDVYRGRRPFG